MVPLPIADFEELRKYRPGDRPRTYRKAGNLRQHRIVILQDPAAPQVEEE